jgi:hypothetical protein
MRNLRLATPGEPISRRKSAPTHWWISGVAAVERWAEAKPASAALTLSVAYLVALVALVAVLAASALNTVLGVGVLILFAVMVVVCIAVGIYAVIPERAPR